MEITELNLICDFDSQIFPISTLSIVPKFYSLFKWTALVLAILAAFSGLIARTKFLVVKMIRIVRTKILSTSSAIDSIKLLNSDDFDYELDDEYSDDDDDTCSSLSSDDERESGGSEEERETVFEGMCRGFSWSDFNTGKSVVRLWDNLISGFDCNNNNNDEEEEQINDEVVSIWAEKANHGGVLLGLYDSRVRSGSPEITAEWPSLRRRWVNSGQGLTVGDLRNVKLPLEGQRWDANSVIGVNYL